jgi:FRG domain
MAWTEIYARELEDLYDILNRLSDTQAYVFRGHASSGWANLEPSLHRMLGSDKKFIATVVLEAAAIRSFRRHARSLLPASEFRYFDYILTSITLMQHYGGPTRLLDWTLSPWVACYFAVQDQEQDAAIWTFNQDELRKYNHLHRASKGYAHFHRLELATSVEDWADAARQAGSYIGVFRYQYANPQMSAQQSLFTIAGRLGDNHNEALERSLPERWQKLRIILSKSYKSDLRQRLFAMNVNPLALFPTPDGVGRNIREAMQCGLSLGDEGLLWELEERARRSRRQVAR